MAGGNRLRPLTFVQQPEIATIETVPRQLRPLVTQSRHAEGRSGPAPQLAPVVSKPFISDPSDLVARALAILLEETTTRNQRGSANYPGGAGW
jgi:hypothetical protein